MQFPESATATNLQVQLVVKKEKKKSKNPRISSPLPPSGGDAVWGLKSSVQDMNTLTHAPALFNPTLPLNSLAACSMTTL
jgi:hypothetical protein